MSVYINYFSHFWWGLKTLPRLKAKCYELISAYDLFLLQLLKTLQKNEVERDSKILDGTPQSNGRNCTKGYRRKGDLPEFAFALPAGL